MAGYTYSFGAGSDDAWLVRVDASGNLLWNQTYGGVLYDTARSVVLTGDGGFALAGETYPGGFGNYDAWLVRVDASGNLLWNQTYGGANDDYAWSGVQTSDGGYALAGETHSFGAGGSDFYFVKTAPELLDYTVGLTVQNTAFDVPPGTYWNYIVVDTSSWNIVKNFTLAANGSTTFSDPMFADGGTFYVTQIPKAGYNPIISAEPNDEHSSAAVINSTTAQVNLGMFGGANVTFNNTPPGFTVQNIVTDIPPDSDWNYLITDLNSTIVYKNFTLPAGGGNVTFTDAVFLNGGQFLVTATSKYGYSPDVTAVCSNGTAFLFSKIQVLLTISANASTVVTFTNDEAGAFAFAKLGDLIPPDWFYNIPPRQPVPFQSACPIDIDNDGKADLVLGKPMAILVNLTDLPQANGLISVRFDGGTFYTQPVTADDIINKRVISFPAIVPNAAGKNKQITGNYTLGANVGPLTTTTVSVKATKDLTLYFVWMTNTAYGNVDEQTFKNNVGNITAFINATYPVKNVTVYATYTGKSVTGTSGPFSTIAKGKTAIETDCTSVKNALSKYSLTASATTIGIGICPNNTGKPDYFSVKGTATSNYSGAVGFSKGPGTKGVVVLDGYYAAGAHEVAHTFKLYYAVPEQYVGKYSATGGMPSNGVWAEQSQWRTGISFMGLIEKGSFNTTWEDNVYTYYWLFRNLTVTAGDPEIVQTNGLIHQDGTVEFTSDWYHTMGTPDPIDPGNYSLKFLDASNHTLNETSFDAQFFDNIDPGTSMGQDIIVDPKFGTVDSDTASFGFATEYPEGTASVQILNNTDPQHPTVIDTVNATDIIDLQPPTTTEAYFTDSDFNPINSFDCLFTPSYYSYYKMTATNPGTFYYNLQVKNNDPAGRFTVTVKIPSDFDLKRLSPRTSPVQIDGKAVYYSISAGGLLKVSNIKINQSQTVTLTVHLDYALTDGCGSQLFKLSSPTTYSKAYAFNATLNSTQVATANIAAVGKKVTAIGGLIKDLLGEPKGGLVVTAINKTGSVVATVISPSDGFYFVAVPAGTYTVKISNSFGTLLAQTYNFKVDKDQFVEKDFTLWLCTFDAAVMGFVKDDLGNGVSGVTVKLLKSGTLMATTTTNLGGYYVFRFFQPGQYTVQITVPPGYTAAVTSKTVWINLAETETVNFNLSLTGP